MTGPDVDTGDLAALVETLSAGLRAARRDVATAYDRGWSEAITAAIDTLSERGDVFAALEALARLRRPADPR